MIEDSLDSSEEDNILTDDSSDDNEESLGKYANDQKRMRKKLRAPINLPQVPHWDNAEKLQYNVAFDPETNELENIVDYESLDSVNNTINSLRVAIFRAVKGLDNTERKLKLAKTEYDREYRREYLTSSERTETRKKEYAALMTEHIEDKIIYLDQMRSELSRRTTLLRDELNIMNTLSNNIRQQVKGG